jgi:hypothetical protein
MSITHQQCTHSQTTSILLSTCTTHNKEDIQACLDLNIYIPADVMLLGGKIRARASKAEIVGAARAATSF